MKTSVPITVGAIGTEEFPPAGLTVDQLARGMMDNLDFVGERVISKSGVEPSISKYEERGFRKKLLTNTSTRRLWQRGERGEFTKPTFWMKDMSNSDTPERSKGDVFTKGRSARGILQRMHVGAGVAGA